MMHFEIVGDITDIETICMGISIRILPSCESNMVLGTGEN